MNQGETAPAETGSPRGWWLLGLSALICLPCVLPLLAAAFLAAGGVGALGSFVGGATGPTALAIGALLVTLSAIVYLARRRWRRRTSQSVHSAAEHQLSQARHEGATNV